MWLRNVLLIKGCQWSWIVCDKGIWIVCAALGHCLKAISKLGALKQPSCVKGIVLREEPCSRSLRMGPLKIVVCTSGDPFHLDVTLCLKCFHYIEADFFLSGMQVAFLFFISLVIQSLLVNICVKLFQAYHLSSICGPIFGTTGICVGRYKHWIINRAECI